MFLEIISSADKFLKMLLLNLVVKFVAYNTSHSHYQLDMAVVVCRMQVRNEIRLDNGIYINLYG